MKKSKGSSATTKKSKSGGKIRNRDSYSSKPKISKKGQITLQSGTKINTTMMAVDVSISWMLTPSSTSTPNLNPTMPIGCFLFLINLTSKQK